MKIDRDKPSDATLYRHGYVTVEAYDALRRKTLLSAAARLRDGEGLGWAEDDAYAEWLEDLASGVEAAAGATSCDYCGSTTKPTLGICHDCDHPFREPGTA